MLSSPNNFRPSTSLFHQFSLSSGPNNHGPKKKREAPIIPQYTPSWGENTYVQPSIPSAERHTCFTRAKPPVPHGSRLLGSRNGTRENPQPTGASRPRTSRSITSPTATKNQTNPSPRSNTTPQRKPPPKTPERWPARTISLHRARAGAGSRGRAASRWSIARSIR